MQQITSFADSFFGDNDAKTVGSTRQVASIIESTLAPMWMVGSIQYRARSITTSAGRSPKPTRSPQPRQESCAQVLDVIA